MKLLLTSKGLATKLIQDHFMSFVHPRKKLVIITTAAMEYKKQFRPKITVNLPRV